MDLWAVPFTQLNCAFKKGLYVLLRFCRSHLPFVRDFGQLKSGIYISYLTSRGTLNPRPLGSLCEKILAFALVFFSFLGRWVESTPQLFVWLLWSWTCSWWPHVWPVGGVMLSAPIPVSVSRREVMSNVVQLSVKPICHNDPSSPALSFTLPPPELALWPTEEECRKRRVRWKTPQGQFVIIVRFKCFCENVVKTCQHRYEAWVPWAGSSIQHIQYVFSCELSVYSFLLPFKAGFILWFLFSGW